jgi:concanavalin A-like lectin/glucanase superfamily protein
MRNQIGVLSEIIILNKWVKHRSLYKMILKSVLPFYGTNFSKFLLLFFSWTILFLSNLYIDGDFSNKAFAQSYSYAPNLTLTGSNFVDQASTSSLQLSQFSVAAWFKTSSDFTTDAAIVNKGGFGSETAGQNMNYGIWMNSAEKIKGGFETSTGSDFFVTSPNTYNDNQWHYAIVTYDGSTVRLYIDGVQVGSKSTSGASADKTGTQPVRIGANSRTSPPTANFFIGNVDEVRVWNDDLTAQQVSDAFAGTSFNTAEQVLFLSFTNIGAGTDIFGIKKLYSTKDGGEEWYMNMENPLSDSRFNPRDTITKNPDGSWKMKATQVRMAVYTSTGFDPDDIPTLDHSIIASKGYMLAPNDWRNFEMTQYVKVNTSPSDDNFSPNGRGGRHTLIDTPPEGCEGSSMKGDVFFSGKVRFAKEQWHVSYVFTSLKSVTGSIKDKWVGIKFVVYNFVENNKVVVKTELWLDTNNNGNFVKVDENVDRGGWGTEDTQCGGAPDQIITWGGPITTFRWDTATDVDFKNLSVREIIPPQ